MTLNWLQSLVYGLVAGLADILPISSRAHKILLLKLFGITGGTELMDLMIHLGLVAALFISCQSILIRFSRARALARVPKRKRRRPLDERSLMDHSLLRTMLVPVILGLILYRKALSIESKLPLLALMLLLNGIFLYIPQFLPTSNRDSRTLSRVEGLLMGIGGGLSAIPGFSAMGLSNAIGSVCGVERGFALNMTLLMNMYLNVGLIVHDIIALAEVGLKGTSFAVILRCLCAGLAAFGAAFLSIRLVRRLFQEHDYTGFSFYCIGLALFIFILNLLA